MGKMFKKIITSILVVAIISTFCAVPMSASAEETYESYDVVTYDDFLDTGNHHLSKDGATFTSKNTLLHYDVTSETHSVIYKFRWVAGTATYVQMYPGVYCTNPFQYRINVSDAQWVKRYAPDNATKAIGYAINEGDEFDIEIARIKVASGENAGKYLSYFKVNGEEIFKTYVSESDISDSRALDDTLQFATNAEDASFAIKATPEEEVEEPADPGEEVLDDYDDIGYADMLRNGSLVNPDGRTIQGTYDFTYAPESSSYSMVYGVRWTAGSDQKIQIYLGNAGTYFAYRIKEQKWFDLSTGKNVPSNRTIAVGDTVDIKVGRILVKAGANKGSYLSFLEVDGERLFESYVSAADAAAYLNEKIRFICSDGVVNGIGPIVVEEPTPEEPVDPNPDALYYDYDELTYYDLIADGNKLTASEYPMNNKTFTYNQTSTTGSVIVKYRWKGANSGSEFQLGLDNEGAFAYMFGMQYYKPSTDYPNGRIWLRPGMGPSVGLEEPIVNGNDYDIEFARLKVKNGENKGKYYLYVKLNGKLIAEDYVDGSVVDANGNYTSSPNSMSCTISNKIYLTFWGGGGGNKIAPIPVPETFDTYDEVTYDKLTGSGNTYTYNATSSSFSSIIKFRWTAGGDEKKFTLFLDDWVYPFCFAVKTPNQYGFGATAGPNGSWHLVPSKDSYIVDMDTPIVDGQICDIEVGRLKVLTGVNAGKYYVYAKVNDVLIKDYYYDGVNADGTYGNGTALSNKVILSVPAGNTISAIPVPETYYDYDEVGFEDLKDSNGNTLGDKKQMSGHTVFTYDQKSETSSVIFKFNWKVGEKAKFQMSFDKAADNAMSYMFGAWLAAPGEEANFPNGRMWLRPAYGPQVNLAEALAPGSSHDIEFARLKVKTGSNTGKYYVYIKIDGVLVAEDYVAADVVDADGNYTTDPGKATVSLSNEIFFAFWGSNGNYITSYGNVIEDKKGDFDFNGSVNASDLTILKKAMFGSITLDAKAFEIADMNSDGVVDILDLVIMKELTLA